MNALVPASNLKTFQTVLACLAKVGEDITLESRPDRYILSTINTTRSAFACFTLWHGFFTNYEFDEHAETAQRDQEGPFLRSRVLAKALVSACKLRGKSGDRVESCALFMEPPGGIGEQCRLAIEMRYKFGVVKAHRLTYEDCLENLRVIYAKDSCKTRLSVPYSSLVGLFSPFNLKIEEVTMVLKESQMTLKNTKDQSADRSDGKRHVATSISFDASEFLEYIVEDEVSFTFSLKEFKAIVQFAESMHLTLDVFCDVQSRPLLFSVSTPGMLQADFAQATIIEDDDELLNSAPKSRSGHSGSATAARTKGVQGQQVGQDDEDGFTHLDLSQPENAFLDDDDWDEGFDPFEGIDENPSPSPSTRSNTAVTVTTATTSTITAGLAPAQTQPQLEPMDEDFDALIADDNDFLEPTQQQNQKSGKRSRLMFGEDD